MKKRIIPIILFLLVVAVCAALTISPEFNFFWQRTPVLKDIYAWFYTHLSSFLFTITRGELRDIYLTIIGSVLITIFVFGFLKVDKVKPEQQEYINVNTTPIINNNAETSVIVVEENRG